MDEDFALALQLSEEYATENEETNNKELQKAMSIVDPAWELIDPVPNIRELFVEFDTAYFDGMLGSVEVKWSSKMTLCAGLCCYQGRGGLCTIKLSTPLLKLRPRKDLVETLLHEMIHALLFVTDNNKDHDGHGPEFHKHMYRINKATGTNISVYHSFHDEVDNYRQHWWRCDGPCVKRPPFYGIVRRAMNRAPSPRDTWWSMHQQKCGGTFTKIKEPEGYGQKKKKGGNIFSEEKEENKNDNNKNNSITRDTKPITNWFSKTGNNANTYSQMKNNHLLKKDSFFNNKYTHSNVKSFNGACSGEQTFAVSSENASSNIHGFKMSARKKEIPPPNIFKGSGRTLNSSNTKTQKPLHENNINVKNSDIINNREKFLKRLESSFNQSSNKRIKLDSNEKQKNIASDTSVRKRIDVTSGSAHIVRKNNAERNVIANRTTKSSVIQISNTEVIHVDDCRDVEKVDLVDCPACPMKIPMDKLNEHLDHCLL